MDGRLQVSWKRWTRIDAKVVSHDRYIAFQMVEVAFEYGVVRLGGDRF